MLLGEQGGWPLTMFLTPAGEPFWGGTYFPKEPRFGRPGFVQVLREIARIYRRPSRSASRTTRDAAQAASRRRRQPGAGRRRSAPADLDRIGARLAEIVDPVHGGLQGAPKFPNPPILEFLWPLRPPERGRDRPEPVPADPGADGAGRHPRSSRRRLRPLFRRRALARAAFREDALRQRAAPGALRAGRARRPGGRCSARAAEGIVAWLAREMTTAGGRLRVEPRRGFGRARRAGSTSGASTRSARSWARTPTSSPRIYDVTGGGNWEGHEHPQPARSRRGRRRTVEARLAPDARQSCSPVAQTASGRASTTRCWPTGTA